MDSNRKIHFNMDASSIIYTNQIFESYEDIGILRTIDKQTTHMCVYTNTWMVERCLDLLNSLKGEGVDIFNVRVEISPSVE